MLLGEFLERDLRQLGIESSKAQSGGVLSTETVDAVLLSYDITAFSSEVDYSMEIKAVRRSALRAFVSNPSISNFPTPAHSGGDAGCPPSCEERHP